MADYFSQAALYENTKKTFLDYDILSFWCLLRPTNDFPSSIAIYNLRESSFLSARRFRIFKRPEIVLGITS
jgi:hypothetical protein